MAFRSYFPLMTIASSSHPQPALGSWVTAVSPATGFAQASGAPLTLTLGTASASSSPAASANDAYMFSGDKQAVLWDPNGSHFETVNIASVSGNTVVLGPKTSQPAPAQSAGLYVYTEFPHVAGAIGTGTYILPRLDVNNPLIVFEDGGTGTWLYIGQGPLFTATFQRIYKLSKTASGTQPSYWNAGMYNPGNAFAPYELFVSGTAGDTYTTSLATD